MKIEQLLLSSKWGNSEINILYEFKNRTLKINNNIIGACVVLTVDPPIYEIQSANIKFKLELEENRLNVNTGDQKFELFKLENR